ncbi:MAG: hypothetical protein MZU97_09620 [Bacillus subtilis]|nr:hypothetical protein [Bacillus subtilis]
MIFQLLRRNLRVYFRDRATVFFSMLGVIIIIGLYLDVPGQHAVRGRRVRRRERPVHDGLLDHGRRHRRRLDHDRDGCASGSMVDDTQKKIIRDFEVSPVQPLAARRSPMSVVLDRDRHRHDAASRSCPGGSLHPDQRRGDSSRLRRCSGYSASVILSVSASSAFVFFITTFLKTANAFSTVSTILGTIVGFLTGAYIPMGVLAGSRCRA